MAQQLQSPGQLAQATIVCAPSREACLQTAEHLASALVCLSSGPVPCGVCRACQKAKAGIHPDILHIRRLSDDKGRPKKEISVDQIRQMAADAVVLPNESERKVYLVEDADAMNLSAQNAALKLLEEPPRGGYFLLCALNPELLLPTVRSRCAVWKEPGQEAPMDPELQSLAEAFLRLVAAGNRAELFRWCAEQDRMDIRAAADFVDCAAACTAERILGRSPAEGLDRAQLQRLLALLNRCREWLQVNVGVKHIMGVLAVEAIADEENRGVQH